MPTRRAPARPRPGQAPGAGPGRRSSSDQGPKVKLKLCYVFIVANLVAMMVLVWRLSSMIDRGSTRHGLGSSSQVMPHAPIERKWQVVRPPPFPSPPHEVPPQESNSSPPPPPPLTGLGPGGGAGNDKATDAAKLDAAAAEKAKKAEAEKAKKVAERAAQKAAAASCEDPSKWIKDADLKGGDLPDHGLKGDVESAGECCAVCRDIVDTQFDGSCVAWTYIPNDKHCWLKGSTPKQKLVSGLVSGFIEGRMPSEPKQKRPGRRPPPEEKPPPPPPCCLESTTSVLAEAPVSSADASAAASPLLRGGANDADGVGVGVGGADATASGSAVKPMWSSTPGAGWHESFPVGNGVLGALVEWGTHEDRIPLSEDSFYRPPPRPRRPPPQKQSPKQPPKSPQKAPQGVKGQGGASGGKRSLLAGAAPPKLEVFRQVRQKFLAGDVNGAEDIAGKLAGDGLGTFSYLAAMRLRFGATEADVAPRKRGQKPPAPPTATDYLRLLDLDTAVSEYGRALCCSVATHPGAQAIG